MGLGIDLRTRAHRGEILLLKAGHGWSKQGIASVQAVFDDHGVRIARPRNAMHMTYFLGSKEGRGLIILDNQSPPREFCKSKVVVSVTHHMLIITQLVVYVMVLV